jgi:hypothetical protein
LALKYCLLKTFIISTGDPADDPDADSGTQAGKQQPASPPQTVKQSAPAAAVEPTRARQKMARPLSPQKLVAVIAEKIATMPTTPASDSQRTTVVSVMDKICAGDDDMRHALLLKLCDAKSTKNLSAAQASALIDWSGANADNKWTPVPEAIQEARTVYDAFQAAAGQAALVLDAPAVKPEPEY